MLNIALEQEIRAAIERLGLDPARFFILPSEEASRVWQAVEARFTGGSSRGWWWERFEADRTAARYIGEVSWAYRYLAEVVPPSPNRLWLIAGDCLERSFVVCEGSIADICDLIGECYSFEYFVVPKDLDWILCENHHDVLIAVGDALRRRLVEMASRHPVQFAPPVDE